MNFVNRRKFLANTTKLLASLGLVSLSKTSMAAQTNNDTIFVHHVLFWLKDPENPAVRQKFEKAVKDLVTIDTIRTKHIGTPASTRREVVDSSYTYSLMLTFKNKADHDSYQTHPIHDTFRGFKDMWTKILIYDSVEI